MVGDPARPNADSHSRSLRVIDSHTAGEPTRTIVAGLPDLGRGSVASQLAEMRESHDWIRASLILEPRGSDVIVGAALVPSQYSDCVSGVLFFNNTGYLHMCGHGMIGVATTLAWKGDLEPGDHFFETSVGRVRVNLAGDGTVRLQNVPSYCWRRDIELELPDGSRVTGDISWGGNWFFITEDHGEVIHLANRDSLQQRATTIRQQLTAKGLTGRDGGEIDHIELVDIAQDGKADFINFVLCPGFAYDRSPCGTGCSAKVASLAACGKLKPGASIRVRGIAGELFSASYQLSTSNSLTTGEFDGPLAGPLVVPTVEGRAFITADTNVIYQAEDPFCFGIQSSLGEPSES